MKKSLLAICIGACTLLSYTAYGQLKVNLASLQSKGNPEDARSLANENAFLTDALEEEEASLEFKPVIQVGGLMHSYFEAAQGRSVAGDPAGGDWNTGFSLYRARVLVGAKLSPKGSFFMETEIPTSIGMGSVTSSKTIRLSPIILDFQYEHIFSNHFSLIFGKQLVSNNRNGLQSAASLMANDFTHYQYPYNMWEEDPLQGNFGRDIGLNSRGFMMNDRLEYRLGVFTGRRFEGGSPMRVVGRLQYSFLDPEKDFYYAGTKLGTGRTFTLAGGVDSQADYINLNVDSYLDIPLGTAGSITANAAFAYLDGGTGEGAKSFSALIPRQNIQFLELGYYFKELKLQPWIKYENQAIKEDALHYGFPELSSQEVDDLNLLASNIRLGAGVNYFFNGYNTNVKLSYTEAIYGRANAGLNGVERAGAGQLWLQLQLFFF